MDGSGARAKHSNSIYVSENLELLKGMFPDMTELELSSLLFNYPGKLMEGLIDKILQGTQTNCSICWDNLYLEDVISCDKDHSFCRSCLKEGIEHQLSEGVEFHTCLYFQCELPYRIPDLEAVMDPKMFSKYVQKICSNEIKNCKELILFSCPQCDFAVTIDEKGLDVIECEYEYCRAETCIHCRKPAHPRGQRCQQYLQEKKRLTVEDSMADAVIRKCYSCKKPYTKIDGCNRIKCVCGAQMCYICKRAIKPNYDHFYDFPEKPEPGKCPLQANSEELHSVERTSAGRVAAVKFDNQARGWAAPGGASGYN